MKLWNKMNCECGCEYIALTDKEGKVKHYCPRCEDKNWMKPKKLICKTCKEEMEWNKVHKCKTKWKMDIYTRFMGWGMFHSGWITWKEYQKFRKTGEFV